AVEPAVDIGAAREGEGRAGAVLPGSGALVGQADQVVRTHLGDETEVHRVAFALRAVELVDHAAVDPGHSRTVRGTFERDVVYGPVRHEGRGGGKDPGYGQGNGQGKDGRLHRHHFLRGDLPLSGARTRKDDSGIAREAYRLKPGSTSKENGNDRKDGTAPRRTRHHDPRRSAAGRGLCPLAQERFAGADLGPAA